VKKFPHLVQMHREFAKDGLVAVSLDVNQAELKFKDRVLAFLTRQEATFPNYILKDTDENTDALLTKYNLEATPAIVLFDRAGQRVRLPDDVSDEELERTVKELLAAK
jgi:thioredoxin-related protein